MERSTVGRWRAALAAVVLFGIGGAAAAADKPFTRDDLADAAIRLEARIKEDAGNAGKPAAALKRDADAAFQRNDPRAGMQALGQIAALAPGDTANWLRLARTILQIWSPNQQERAELVERAATAAYIAYQRTTRSDEEADALALMSRTFAERKLWRPALDTARLSLDIRETADLRASYERLRADHGFRLLDYSVDSDSASPRACFQFSEALPGRRTDFTPFVAVAGQDKPALSADDKQLCVEGLKHGERYAITLRPGLPSVVKESLAKAADFTIYVRDRKPFARFAAKAYVLPRAGQRGIPVVSVNTKAVRIAVYRVGDRNLINTVVGADFQRNLSRYEFESLASERGAQVWKGELAVEPQLNADVTTAFPVDEALGTLAPGVYVMSAEPAGIATAEDYDALATQWFVVSDLGLTAQSGNDGIRVLVNSLATAAGKPDVEVRLLARNNEVLATQKTGADGAAVFAPGLARGEGGSSPALVVASDATGDYAFLSLKSPAFDLSDRGVAGRPAPAGLDAFVYTERGVYRTGETVHVAALLRDARGVAAPGAPLTLVVQRPDGVDYRRAVVSDQGLGGRSLDVAIAATASTGTWSVRAYADPKGKPIGETTFLVEDYVPDRIEFTLASQAAAIAKGPPVTVTVEGRYLYGAPAANLSLDGEVKIKPAAERAGFPGYQFGAPPDDNADEDGAAVEQPLENLPDTDANGRASVPVALDKLPDTTRPLEATIAIRMAETGGRAVERTLTLPVTPAATMIGVKPLFEGRSLDEGANATFDVIAVAPDGKAVARRGLRYELFRIETRYQWYRRDGVWDYEPIKQTARVADGALDVAADKPGRIAAPVSVGRYRLDVSDADGTVTSVPFEAGYYADAGADTPDMLEMALDKAEYRAGDTMAVSVEARAAGELTLDVIGDRLLTTVRAAVKPGANRVPLTVGRDWGNGAYVLATLRRPLDAAAQRMPGRAIGVQWFSIDRKARTLAVNLNLPQAIRPNGALHIPAEVSGLAPGEEARIVVAAVDVGILNLTNYKPPAPDDYFLGQRALSAEVRDLYGQLIDGMQGTRGQIRSGGDVAGPELQGSPPAQAPLALYSGIVTVGADGKADIAFDIPDFAGTARVMAVAWSKDKVGRAAGDVVIRDPVVVTATLPRFLLAGDHSAVQLDIDNVEGPAGDYKLSVTTDGPATAEGGARTLPLAAKQRLSLSVPLAAAAGVGTAHVTVRVEGPGGFALERAYALGVKPATQVLARRTVKPIAPGGRLTVSGDLFSDLVPGTGSVALSVGPSSALDVASLVKALDRYPFGCSEQIASRAMPLLYVNELASEAHLALDASVDERIETAIARLLARQGSNGSFGLWSVGGDDAWLDAYVTDFLTRARERKFAVPDEAFSLALDRLRNIVANAPEPDKDGGKDLAYALYVLAKNGAAPLGDLRYIADTKLDVLETPVAKAQVAAALALMGDRGRAALAYAAALAALKPPPRNEAGRADYGTALRDAAAVVTLAAEGGAGEATVTNAVARVETARAATVYTSTQEEAWMVLAARALGRDGRLSLAVDGEARRSPLYRTVRAADMPDAGVTIENRGDAPVQAVVSVSGAPQVAEPAAEHGFRIERNYFTLDGVKADPSTVKQNTRLVVVLKVTEPQPQFGRLIVADYLPAGFEIDNPALVSSGDTGTLGWIADGAAPAYSEFRDDHFGTAFDRTAQDRPVFTVAYVVRAVSPGQYVQPQAYVEDMYRPDRYGRTATGSVAVTAAK